MICEKCNFYEFLVSGIKKLICDLLITNPYTGVTLLFEHSRNRGSEIERFEILSRLRENQLTWWFFVKFNLLLFFLIS